MTRSRGRIAIYRTHTHWTVSAWCPHGTMSHRSTVTWPEAIQLTHGLLVHGVSGCPRCRWEH